MDVGFMVWQFGGDRCLTLPILSPDFMGMNSLISSSNNAGRSFNRRWVWQGFGLW